MSGLETQIFQALAAQIDLFVGENPIEIAYPGVAYTPGNQPFLRPWLLPAPTLATDLGRGVDYKGIFQVDVFWPAGQGLTPALEMASALIAYFPRGTQLASDDLTVRINEPPYLGPPLQEPGWLQVPVNIRFRVLS